MTLDTVMLYLEMAYRRITGRKLKITRSDMAEIVRTVQANNPGIPVEVGPNFWKYHELVEDDPYGQVHRA